MARLARVVLPGIPHHVTQRGNGRQQTFFADGDYALYRDLLAAACREAGVEAWAWCLMPNHVHLILVPGDADGLRQALAPVHRAYAGAIHARQRCTGHFWQGRFGAVALDEAWLAAAVRYVLMNPVRARLVDRPGDWRWSSIHAHLNAEDGGAEDGLTLREPIETRFPGLAGQLDADEADDEAHRLLRRAETIGRPLGGPAFLARAQAILGRPVAPRKRGPKPKVADGSE